MHSTREDTAFVSKQPKSESLADKALSEELLAALNMNEQDQQWFRRILYDQIKDEAEKQEFVQRFYDFLAKNGREQDQLVTAVKRRRGAVVKQLLKRFAQELELFIEDSESTKLERLRDRFNARQKPGVLPLKEQ